MIDAKSLLSDLQKLLAKLEGDIRTRCDRQAEVDAPLRERYAAARAANRTAEAYEIWRDEQITQSAVAWILSCVFVRFCEDNRLIDPPRLSGPGERRQRAEDEYTIYVQKFPTHSDREYLLSVFEKVADLPAMKELFDKRHNPLWSLGVSGDGAMALRDFWLKRDAATGLLAHDFTTEPGRDAPESPGESRAETARLGSDDPTRFLGDLYQDLSESARKKYALLQTPVFVEEFILDRTLEPAIREFGFQQVRMIDPTCGSGHFLLGGFHRLLDRWVKREPATNVRELVRRALSQVYGVDLNPYAVAIARFRLVVAALRACDVKRLDAADFASHINLAAGDSLLHGPRPGRDVERATGHLWDADELKHYYETEDADRLRSYLGQQYHAVVGNPPYITPKDKALNDAYRQRFASCHMKYSLAVPFFEGFVDLTLSPSTGTPGEARGEGDCGFVGMITANSFMKREFGKKIIEQMIPKWDLTHIIDTAGAYIPGHGTPTVIIFGRHRRPTTSKIRTAMGIAGEPATPVDPAHGLVWTAIVEQLDQPGSQSRFISVGDTARNGFHTHPWSIGGGGAAELKELLDENAAAKLVNAVHVAGILGMTNADDVMLAPPIAFRRARVERLVRRPLALGDGIRDWVVTFAVAATFPYSDEHIVPIENAPGLLQWLWPCRTVLGSRATFARLTYFEEGRPWWEWHQVTIERLRTPLSIVFGEVATHNHFVLDRGGKVFNRTAPVIKLPADATEDDHLALLGLLNSSTACFWLKQVCHNKGSTVDQHGARQRTAPFEDFFAFNSTKLEPLPLPDARPVALAKRLDRCAAAYAGNLPEATCTAATPEGSVLMEAWQFADNYRGEMIAFQEELDWQCYVLYGLISGPEAANYEFAAPPPIALGQRAFENSLARRIAAGEEESTWFVRHGSTPITEIPDHWPEDYKQVIRRRIEIIESDKNIALIERPEYKRRWNTEPWEEMQERALRGWLLDRLEGWPVLRTEEERGGTGEQEKEQPGPRSLIWNEHEPRLMSVAQLADRMRQDKDFLQVAALYRGREDFDITKLVAELVEDEAVPLLPVLRYKESGLRNRRVWEQVWDLQRQEDAIDARTELPATDPQYLTEQQAKAEKKAKVGDIPVPPKYKSADMLPGPIWRLRGKLDVPKERFVSFPHCQRDADPTLVITWAGFDHLQQLQALAAYYMDMKDREGWPPDRRVPLLASMLELLPWVLQWHNDLDPQHQLRMGDYYRDFINDEAKEVGKTIDEIRAWVPVKNVHVKVRKNSQ